MIKGNVKKEKTRFSECLTQSVAENKGGMGSGSTTNGGEPAKNPTENQLERGRENLISTKEARL